MNRLDQDNNNKTNHSFFLKLLAATTAVAIGFLIIGLATANSTTIFIPALIISATGGFTLFMMFASLVSIFNLSKGATGVTTTTRPVERENPAPWLNGIIGSFGTYRGHVHPTGNRDYLSKVHVPIPVPVPVAAPVHRTGHNHPNSDYAGKVPVPVPVAAPIHRAGHNHPFTHGHSSDPDLLRRNPHRPS